jgi:predicted nucleotidyltransferase
MHPKDQTSLVEDMHQIIRVFNENDIDYALCGGLAVAIYGFARYTQDIDLMIQPDDLTKAKAVLKTIDDNLSSGIIPFKQPDETWREISRVSKAVGSELYTLDLMLCTGSLNEAWDDRELVELGGHDVKVVSKRSLIAMKKEAARNKDLIDIEELSSND